MRASILHCGWIFVVCLSSFGCDGIQSTLPDGQESQTQVNRPEAEPVAGNQKPVEPQPAPQSQAEPAAPETPSEPPHTPLPLADMIELIEPAVVRIDVESADGASLGSGFLVSDTGLVATNYHVIAGARTAKATFHDGETANVLGTVLLNPTKDLAILQIERPKTPRQPLVLAATLPRKGESVVTFGSPRGLSFTASEGIVSALRTGKEVQDTFGEDATMAQLIQTTAPISGGNSGGPLVNLRGEVVGVNTMCVVVGQNLNFAVSAIDLAEVVRASAGQPTVAFKDVKFPSTLSKAKVEPATDGGGLAARVERELERERERYLRKLEETEKELVTLEGTIRAKEQLLEVVKAGGDEAIAIMRRYPAGKSRTEWVRRARQFIEERQKELTKKRAEIKQDREMAEAGLFPVPLLPVGDLAVGRFGHVLVRGKVSQVLADGEFIAYFGGVQVHCAGFNLGNFSDDAPVFLNMVCIVPDHYAFTTVTGARRTIFSLRPFDPAILTPERREAFAKRAELLAARMKVRIEEWHAEIERNRQYFNERGRLPALGTNFEPEFLADILTGDKELKAPNLPKRYATEVIVTKVPRSTPNGVIYTDAYTTKQYETAESKRWRKEQLDIFNARKEVFPAYSLDALIGELQNWANDPTRVCNHDDSLQMDIEKLVEVAFTAYGVTANRDNQRIPWSDETREKIVTQLQEIAIRYGKVAPEDFAEAAEEQPAESEEEQQEKAAASALNLAKLLLSRKEREIQGEERLRQLMEDYPETAAAKEAEKILNRRGK